MTKLLEWISVLSAAFAVWYSLVGGYVKHPIIDNNMNLILISPILFVIIFGLYAVTVVLYRVFTFNDCIEASIELHEEIKEAKKCEVYNTYDFVEVWIELTGSQVS